LTLSKPTGSYKMTTFDDLPLLVRERQLLQHVPWHRSTLWAKVRGGAFPQPVRLGPGSVAWRREDLVEWYGTLEPVEAGTGAAAPEGAA
jgi:predicted DNA-binding transcriptional regulator AlpA